MALHDLLAPDGYLLGWNQGAGLHPHMHVIPRFDDEPLSDRGLRSAINVPEQTARSMGARERTGTSECQVSEAPGQFSSRLLDPLPAARVANYGGECPAGCGLVPHTRPQDFRLLTPLRPT